MGDEKRSYRYEAFLPSPGYMFTQTAMLFITYGLKYDMPWWVLWFPSLIYLIVALFIFVVMISVVIGSAWSERY